MSLVLSRADGQSIIVDDRIKITIVSPHRCKLIIDAPHDVPIRRGEIAKKGEDDGGRSSVLK